MSRSLSVARGVALRGTRSLLKEPPLLVAPMIVPLFFFAAFTGALSAISHQKGWNYYSFSAFVFIFTLYMASMLVGVFTAFDIALDYQIGMGRRMMLSAPRRMAIVAGYLMVALGRALVAQVFVWGVALVTGMPVRGQPIQIAGIVAIALMLNIAVTLYGAGVALRLQTATAATVILIPVYMVLFMTPVFVPRHNLTPWLRTVAGVNPLTPPIEAARGLLANEPLHVALAFLCAAGLIVALFMWAILGMRAADRKG